MLNCKWESTRDGLRYHALKDRHYYLIAMKGYSIPLKAMFRDDVIPEFRAFDNDTQGNPCLLLLNLDEVPFFMEMPILPLELRMRRTE